MSEPNADHHKQRRSRRRIAIVVIVLLTLPIWYVAAWLTAALACHRGYFPQHAHLVAHPFMPLISLANSNTYGGTLLTRLYCTVLWNEISHVPLPAEPQDERWIAIQFGPFSPNVQSSLYRELLEAHFNKDTMPSPRHDPWASPSPRTAAPTNP
jgi:hypothetical protein